MFGVIGAYYRGEADLSFVVNTFVLLILLLAIFYFLFFLFFIVYIGI